MKKKLTSSQLKKKIKKAIDSGSVEIAPTEKLDKVFAMAHDFVEHCLMKCESDFMITDRSYVSDFIMGNKKEALGEYKRAVRIAKARYSIDISTVINKPIVDIAGYILRRCAN